jgi:DNA-binding MurR/RpiR family transcriptional regulator
MESTARVDIPMPAKQTPRSPRKEDSDPAGIGRLISESYPSLSAKLRVAARYVIDRPEDVALYSMRSVASRALVHPTTMLRLARELGYENYEVFREHFRRWLATRHASFADRARNLKQRRERANGLPLVDEILLQELRNIETLLHKPDRAAFLDAAKLLDGARHIYVLGLRSLYPPAFYFYYQCRMFTEAISMVDGPGGTFGDALRNIREQDVLLAFSHQPYARGAVRSVEYAHERGAKIIVVTDSELAPIVRTATVSMVVTNATPSLFPSVLPAMAIAQALVAVFLSERGEDVMVEIAKSERQLARFEVYVDQE